MPRGRPASLSKSLGGAKRGIDNVAPEWHESYYPTAAPSSSSSSLSAAINKRRNDDGGGHGQKKARTSISGARQQPEKRLKRIRNSCPNAVQERADRVWQQRFFCVARNRTGLRSEEFSELGSTGNVYTVYIESVPRCTCPDAVKGNTCKHILFVMLKVLQVPHSSNLWYQAALLSSELESIFAHARPPPQSAVDQRVSQAYRIATGQEKSSSAASNFTTVTQKRLPQEGDSCPVCYEDLTPGSEAGLVFCLSIKGCGNGLHAECFQNWSRAAKDGRATCVMCREPWHGSTGAASAVGRGSAAGPSYSREGYMNLSALTGQSPVRDTSTYYHGPRRGHRGYRNGYHDYDNDHDDDDSYDRYNDQGCLYDRPSDYL